MRNFFYFSLGAITVLTMNATFLYEADITAHYTREERLVRVQETPNTDGMTKRVTDEVYIDHIFRGIISNEVIYATNEVDSGIAKFHTVSVDERRNQ